MKIPFIKGHKIQARFSNFDWARLGLRSSMNLNAVEDFTRNHKWINVFGETIITQLPDEMVIGVTSQDSFGYLMLFTDGNRIDLTLYPVNLIQPNYWSDSLTVCWLDKDARFTNLPKPADTDYLIKAPTLKEFSDTCNEFWWVSTYVVKGLARQQIPYAKEMMETVVRPMFMKMISWRIGTQTSFSVSFGKSGKYCQILRGVFLSTGAKHLCRCG